MPPDAVQLFEAVAGDLLEELGYARVHPKVAPDVRERATAVRDKFTRDLGLAAGLSQRGGQRESLRFRRGVSTFGNDPAPAAPRRPPRAGGDQRDAVDHSRGGAEEQREAGWTRDARARLEALRLPEVSIVSSFPARMSSSCWTPGRRSPTRSSSRASSTSTGRPEGSASSGTRARATSGRWGSCTPSGRTRSSST